MSKRIYEMKAAAVKTQKFTQRRQPISGFHTGYEVEWVWSVMIEIGTSKFYSQKSYKDRNAAIRAAKRINGKDDIVPLP